VKYTIKYDEAREKLIDFINSFDAVEVDARFDGANITVISRGVTFVFFIDGPGCYGEDLDYLDHMETATGIGDFDDWSDAHESHMNPIDKLPDGDREKLVAIIDELLAPILERR